MCIHKIHSAFFITLFSLLLASCGGGGSSSTSTTVGTPTGLSVTIQNGSNLIDWSPVSNATRYTVYYKRMGTSIPTVGKSDGQIDAGVSTQVSHTSLPAGSTYYYRVTASDSNGEGSLGSTVHATQNTRWQRVYPATTLNRFTGIAWTGSLYVAVDNGGNAYASPDLNTWSIPKTISNKLLTSIIYDGTKLIAVGNSGTILTSVDAITWTSIPSGTHGYLSRIRKLGNLYFITGEKGTLLSSNDGINWSIGTIANNTTILYDITWNNNLYVITARDLGTNTAKVYYSNNASTWTEKDLGTSAYNYTIVWNGAKFITTSGSSVGSSTDGTNWSYQNLGGTGLLSLAGNGAQSVAFDSQGNTYYTSNGSNWTPPSRVFQFAITELSWTNNRFIAMGDGVILSSTDGINWTTHIDTRNNVVRNFKKMASSGNVHVSLGYATPQIMNGISGPISITSADGVNWTERGISSSNNVITWNGSQFISLGSTAGKSNDGINWTYTSFSPTGAINDIAWSGSLLVAAGQGIITTSPNGTNWTHRITYGSFYLKSIIRGGNQFVAVGLGGIIMTSPDGTNWTTQTTGITDDLNDIGWNGTRYIAVGYKTGTNKGVIYSSTDGINWALVTSTELEDHLYQVTWTGKEFITTGYSQIGNTIMYSSTDGSNWVNEASGMGSSPTDILSTGNKILIQGIEGTIISATP